MLFFCLFGDVNRPKWTRDEGHGFDGFAKIEPIDFKKSKNSKTRYCPARNTLI